MNYLTEGTMQNASKPNINNLRPIAPPPPPKRICRVSILGSMVETKKSKRDLHEYQIYMKGYHDGRASI